MKHKERISQCKRSEHPLDVTNSVWSLKSSWLHLKNAFTQNTDSSVVSKFSKGSTAAVTFSLMFPTSLGSWGRLWESCDHHRTKEDPPQKNLILETLILETNKAFSLFRGHHGGTRFAHVSTPGAFPNPTSLGWDLNLKPTSPTLYHCW